jgi:DNA-directed RNA polymerase specialized sigma24 family protein
VEASLSNKKGLTPECFEQLLQFLGPDREEAGKRYEAIRLRLIQIFTHRGCSDPEELADRTFDRVCGKIEEITPAYDGDPARYFYGVANNIHHESFRIKSPRPLVDEADLDSKVIHSSFEADLDIEVIHTCLAECLALQSQVDRAMMLEYYRGEGEEMIVNRKRLAERLGISLGALRSKVLRRRIQLDKCITSCLNREGVPRNNSPIFGIVK